MTVAYLGLGSNVGDREQHLAAAVAALDRRSARVLRQSSVVETEPYGITGQPRFLNQVLEAEWGATPRLLLEAAQAVEAELGRTRRLRWGPREIDVDILLFGAEEVNEHGLVIPHPGLWEREFVLRSLAELRPDILGRP